MKDEGGKEEIFIPHPSSLILPLTEVQVDELWALVGLGRAEASPQAPSAHRHAHAWVWAAIDPVSKLLLATLVGDRSLASAQGLIHAVGVALAPGVVPLFLTMPRPC